MGFCADAAESMWLSGEPPVWELGEKETLCRSSVGMPRRELLELGIPWWKRRSDWNGWVSRKVLAGRWWLRIGDTAALPAWFCDSRNAPIGILPHRANALKLRLGRRPEEVGASLGLS